MKLISDIIKRKIISLDTNEHFKYAGFELKRGYSGAFSEADIIFSKDLKEEIIKWIRWLEQTPQDHLQNRVCANSNIKLGLEVNKDLEKFELYHLSHKCYIEYYPQAKILRRIFGIKEEDL